MFKKNLCAALVGLAVTVGASGANAFYLNEYDGALKFVLSGVDEGALYAGSCNSEATCDSVGYVGGGVQGGVAGEDSWGIFQVTSILGGPSGNTTLWTSGTDGEYIVGKFGGVKDIKADVGFPGLVQKTWSQGGTFDLFLTTTSTLLDTAIALGPTAAARAAITGTSFLEGNFAGVVSPLVAGANVVSTYDGLEHTLSSNGFIDFTGGSYLPLIKPNTVPDNEFDFNSFTPNPNYVDAGYSFSWDTVSTATNFGWTVPFTGATNTSAVPEPGSMALAGLGLMGLAALRRRKQKA